MSDVRGPNQDTVPQPGGLLVLKLAGAPAKVSLGILWNKMEPMEPTRVTDQELRSPWNWRWPQVKN